MYDDYVLESVLPLLPKLPSTDWSINGSIPLYLDGLVKTTYAHSSRCRFENIHENRDGVPDKNDATPTVKYTGEILPCIIF